MKVVIKIFNSLTAISAQYCYKQVVEVSLYVIVMICQNHSSITAVRTTFSLFTYKPKKGTSHKHNNIVFCLLLHVLAELHNLQGVYTQVFKNSLK